MSRAHDFLTVEGADRGVLLVMKGSAVRIRAAASLNQTLVTRLAMESRRDRPALVHCPVPDLWLTAVVLGGGWRA